MMRRTLTLAAFALAACGGSDVPAEDAAAVALPALPVPTDSAIATTLTGFHEFMSLQWVRGDSIAFASNYADTTDLWVSGVGPHWTRDAVLRGFAQQGVAMQATALRRESSGISVDGRMVTDSGAYEIEAPRSALPAGLDARGWYWTRWEFTEHGQWRIVSDELLGASRRPSDRAERPTRPTS
jgi:hypothetical protein